MSVLHIHLLGNFQLSADDKPITEVNQARQQAFLAYLLLHRHAPQSRQHLAFLFWPDAPEEQARTNLRNLLHKIRQALPEADRFVQSDSQTVQWRPDAPFRLDVADFEATLARTETYDTLAQAAHLYAGDLLPSCYDDWIQPERERLCQMAMVALARLAKLLEAAREYRTAIGYTERLLGLDPLNETTYCTLMHLHTADNDRAGALHVFQRCKKTLWVELAVEPSAATYEIYQRLLRADFAPLPRSPGKPDRLPLVGRSREWKRLQDVWLAASSHTPQCVVLSGEAGIGKTRLAEELSAWVESQGNMTAAAHCYAAEGTLVYAPVVSWLRSAAINKRLAGLEPLWLGQVASLLPELLVQQPDLPLPGSSSESWQRQNLFEALALSLLRDPSPLLLFVDDLQWVDRDTMEWLHFLLRFDDRARLLLVATVRIEDAATVPHLQSFLAALRRDGRITELEIGPLSAAETTAVAEAVAGSKLGAQDARMLFQETEGNPLFVVETVRARAEMGAARQSVSTIHHLYPPVDARMLPSKVHAVIHTRLTQLSPQAREVTGLAAVIGREFNIAVLARASEQNEDALVASLDELWQRRIVQERGGDVYDFTHDKLREVAYNSLSAARRRLLHRRIAQALEIEYSHSLDAISGQVAVHYELGGLLAQAIPYYQRAGEAAERIYSHVDAIAHLRRALSLRSGVSGQTGVSFLALHEQLGDILHLTGQYEEARIVYQRGLAELLPADSLIRARLLRKIGNTWRDQHGYTEAVQAYSEAEWVLHQSLDSSDPPQDRGFWLAQQQERIQVLLDRELLHYWLGQVDESVALFAELQPLLDAYATPGQRASFYQNLARLDFRRNRNVATAESIAWARLALSVLQETDNNAAIPAAHFFVGFCLLWSCDSQGALEPLQTALRLAEETVDVSLQARCLAYLTIACRRLLRLEECDQLINQFMQMETATHMPEYAGMAWANRAWLAWRVGNSQAAEDQGQSALTIWRQLPAGHASLRFQWIVRWPLLAVALGGGQISAAIEHARTLLDPAQQRMPDLLDAFLSQASQLWEQHDALAASHLLEQALTLAQETGYL